MNTIKIKDKEYKIKYTIRAMFIWENIMEKTFKLETIMDNYVFFYSMILANNPDDMLQWDEFIEALDENPMLIQELSEALNAQELLNRMQSNTKATKGGGKQKKS